MRQLVIIQEAVLLLPVQGLLKKVFRILETRLEITSRKAKFLFPSIQYE